MSTIPANQIVSVTPNVLNAGGSALVLNGLFLTQTTRVPIGTVQSFASAPAVSAYFGASSIENQQAAIYFAGFSNSNKLPGSLLFATYPQDEVSAYLRGGNVSGLTLTQLQAINGSLTVIVDGVARVAASINLSGAASFTAAAALIQTGLNSAPTTQASVTGSIAVTNNSFTGSIAGGILTVSAMTSGTIVRGTIITGTGVTVGTMIQNQLSGTTGGIGTYAVSIQQTVPSTAIAGTYGTLTVTAVSSGTLAVGQQLAGAGVTANTQITQLGTGTGLTGTYFVTPSQTAASTAVTATPVPVVVSFDSVSGGFIVTSGITGAASTVAFATGTISASLDLTSATGAVVSQGSNGLTPAAFMNSIVAVTQNWATFMLIQDPDGGVGNTQKLAFSQWTGGVGGGTAPDSYAFICWDNDQSPTTSSNAAASLGQLIAAAQLDGTSLIGGVTGQGNTENVAAFVSGAVAAIDFTQTNGRSTLAFKSQSGLTATVTALSAAANLLANFYNFYGAYATASQTFIFLYNGSVSGKFQWLDSYVNQIWLNNGFQQALINLLTQVKSIPYNAAGYSLIEAALGDQINAGLNFGAIRAGVTLSSSQTANVNSAAGNNQAATVLATRGWYLQVKPASPQVRQARGTPPMTFWYMDGQSVQQINLTSVLLQ